MIVIRGADKGGMVITKAVASGGNDKNISK